MDEGIISEKEFEDKKKQLLGLWVLDLNGIKNLKYNLTLSNFN
jgi:hypothetical protein